MPWVSAGHGLQMWANVSFPRHNIHPGIAGIASTRTCVSVTIPTGQCVHTSTNWALSAVDDIGRRQKAAHPSPGLSSSCDLSCFPKQTSQSTTQCSYQTLSSNIVACRKSPFPPATTPLPSALLPFRLPLLPLPVSDASVPGVP